MSSIRRSWRPRLLAVAAATAVVVGGGAVAAQATTDKPTFELLNESAQLEFAPEKTAAVGKAYSIPEASAVEDGAALDKSGFVVTVTSPDGVTSEISPSGSGDDRNYEFTPQRPGDYTLTYSAVGDAGAVDTQEFPVVAGDEAEVQQARTTAARPSTAGRPPRITFGALGDIHNQWRDLDKAFDLFHAEKMDAALFVGDLTNNATAGEYAGLKEVLDRRLDENGDGTDDIDLVAALGNHDIGGSMAGYDLFTQATGGQRPNADYTINGYHFITVSPGAGEFDEATGRPTQPNTGNYAYARDWLQSRLAADTAENPDRPVFVLVHHPLRCTHYVSNEWYGAGLSTGCGDTFKSVFDAYPQAVVWGGHIHTPNNISTSIWQDGGFTTVNAPPLAYFEMESGVDNDTTPNDAGDNAQTSIVEVNGSVVTVKNYDLQAGQWIDQTWKWDVKTAVKNPQKNFPFTNRRAAATKGPLWPKGSAVTVSDIRADAAQVSFRQALPAPNNVQDIVHIYRYEVVDKTIGAKVADFKQWSGFYILPLPPARGHAITGLTPNTEYEVRITPHNTWGKAGKPITTTFTTSAG
ncbi:metallophosphoesterase [Actinopolymorpha alba]|uniref:metallophosphoesterase n=1 Tax=Actinopolymorpha alba TaxID=533267 RepID=UPI0003805AC8|nr:metallophosphoesterase [Actinopolymorpha alba]